MARVTSESPDLRSVVDEATLLPDDRLAEYAVDGVTPSVVAVPRSIEELSNLLRAASERGLRVVPWGGGTKMGLGNPPAAVDLVVVMTSLDGLKAHEAADLTVSVQAGMTLASLQERLAEQGQYLPLQAPLPDRSTIGGVLATASSGPWRLAYGSPRDWLIGSSVVLADGTQAKSGGQVVKNVTGYDLNKLYTGSLGTLAVIVGATFKVSPLPTQRGTMAACFESVEAALDASHQLLSASYLPRALQLVAGGLGSWLPELAQSDAEETYLLVEHAGGVQAVAAKMAETRDLLTQHGAASIRDLTDGDVWQHVVDMGWVDPQPGDLVLRAMTQPSFLPALVLGLQGSDALPRMVADPGYGLLRMMWPGCDEALPESLSEARMVEAINELRSAATSLDGHLVVERCPLAVKEQADVWGEVEGIALMQRIKQMLDPQNTLNPGRFVAGI